MLFQPTKSESEEVSESADISRELGSFSMILRAKTTPLSSRAFPTPFNQLSTSPS